MNYTTLYHVRQYLLAQSTETADDALLTRLINNVTGMVDKHCHRRFDVRQETRFYDYPPFAAERFGDYDLESTVVRQSAYNRGYGRSAALRFDDDLLELSTLTNGDGTEIASTSYVLYPANEYPKFKAELLNGSVDLTWETGSNNETQQVISVAGLWGYHDRYNEAWVDTLETVGVSLGSTTTTLTVADADGVAGDGVPVRFQAGNMLKIENEFLDLIAVDYNTNTLTFTRGYNGTTAVTHSSTKKIYVYRPMSPVVRAAERWVVYLYRQKDINHYDTQQILGTGVLIKPSYIPPDVSNLLPAPSDRATQRYGLL